MTSLASYVESRYCSQLDWCIYVHDNLQVNLGDDYRGHLVAAHGVKHNFNYYMQQVRMRLLNIFSEIARFQ